VFDRLIGVVVVPFVLILLLAHVYGIRSDPDDAAGEMRSNGCGRVRRLLVSADAPVTPSFSASGLCCQLRPQPFPSNVSQQQAVDTLVLNCNTSGDFYFPCC
jgi:hypothetical protein